MSNIPGGPGRNQGPSGNPEGYSPRGHVESFSQKKERLVKPLPPPQKGDLASEEHRRLMREGSPSSDPIDRPSRREICGADVELENIRWLWQDYIPLGMATLLEGNPGEGKSLIASSFCRSITRGKDWPDGSPCTDTGPVIWMSAEDSIGNTIAPRLAAAGADPYRMWWYTHTLRPDDRYWHPTFPRDIDQLLQMILNHGARGLILDPLSAYMDKGMSSNDENDVREVLGAIHAVCEETLCAAICLRHLNKKSGGNSLYRGGGSIAIIGSARSALLVGRDPNTQTHVLALNKANNADVDAAPAWAYKIESCEVGDDDNPIRTARLVWLGQSSCSRDQLLRDAEQPSKVDEVGNALAAAIMAGEDITSLATWAAEHDLPYVTVNRAMKAIGATKKNDGMYGLDP